MAPALIPVQSPQIAERDHNQVVAPVARNVGELTSPAESINNLLGINGNAPSTQTGTERGVLNDYSVVDSESENKSNKTLELNSPIPSPQRILNRTEDQALNYENEHRPVDSKSGNEIIELPDPSRVSSSHHDNSHPEGQALTSH
jgi:hypothetical protein